MERGCYAVEMMMHFFCFVSPSTKLTLQGWKTWGHLPVFCSVCKYPCAPLQCPPSVKEWLTLQAADFKAHHWMRPAGYPSIPPPSLCQSRGLMRAFYAHLAIGCLPYGQRERVQLRRAGHFVV
ncbi:hypothetical protein FKM82_022202 [Ascaphus truei]